MYSVVFVMSPKGRTRTHNKLTPEQFKEKINEYFIEFNGILENIAEREKRNSLRYRPEYYNSRANRSVPDNYVTIPGRICGLCKIWLPASAFSRSRKIPGGLQYYCKDCKIKKQGRKPKMPINPAEWQECTRCEGKKHLSQFPESTITANGRFEECLECLNRLNRTPEKVSNRTAKYSEYFGGGIGDSGSSGDF